MNRVPSNAYDVYLEMGEGRSYQALADHFEVSKTAIVKRAKKEKWRERIARLEEEARKRVEEQAIDEMQLVRERQLKGSRLLQSRALQVLKDEPPARGIRAAAALNIAWKHELLILGEPTERQASVEEVIKREMRELLRVVPEDDPDQSSDGSQA